MCGGRTVRTLGLFVVQYEEGCQKRRDGVSSLQKSTEMCLGRQIGVSGNSGRLTKGTWTTKKQIHDINVQCVGILFYTSGLEVVLPLNQWSSRTEPGGSNDDKKFLMKHPLPFLE